MAKLLIACVNYHNHQEVTNYIEHVFHQSVTEDIEIVVTDNSNDPQEFMNLSKQLHTLPHVTCINAKSNLGYFKGINYGISEYLKNHEMPEWIVISNTDITYQTDHFFKDLFTFYPNGYNYVLAPSIYSDATKKYQNPLLIERYKKAKIKTFILIFKYPLIEYIFDKLNNIKNKFQPRKISLLNNQAIYSGHGACLIVNKNYFIHGGDLNYGSFLFGEEIYIAEMVKELGGSVYFDNRLEVIHYEHSTISKQKRKKINQFYYHSMKYLYHTFYK